MGTLCLSAAALFKAGANVSTDLTVTQISSAILQAESVINVETRHNWVDAYPTLNADVKYILEQACSDLAAVYLINYDPDSIGRSTAELRMDVLTSSAYKTIKTLTDLKNRGFVIGA